MYVNYVSPITWHGRKVWAIGSRLYTDRPPNETFHEFILHVLRHTLGEPWRAEQAALPDPDRHFILKCFERFSEFKKKNTDPEELAREGQVCAEMNGWVRYLMSLAWDVASLVHAADLPDALIDRLRDREQYQGARYEIAIAAIFARLDCAIRWLDQDPSLRGVKHVEFEATHRPTEQTFAVEAKSRHRSGVLNQPGDADTDDPLRTDARMVRRLFVKAIVKAPDTMPYFVFIDINAPLDADIDERWKTDVQRWMNRLPTPTSDEPDDFNAVYVTNFSPHYDGDDISRGGSWLGVMPRYVGQPLEYVPSVLMKALDTYGSVPSIDADGALLA